VKSGHLWLIYAWCFSIVIVLSAGAVSYTHLIMLAEPFFWPKDLWLKPPTDFNIHGTQQGKGYEVDSDTGKELWAEVEQRLRLRSAIGLEEDTATLAAIESHGMGKPQIVLPRLGQG